MAPPLCWFSSPCSALMLRPYVERSPGEQLPSLRMPGISRKWESLCAACQDYTATPRAGGCSLRLTTRVGSPKSSAALDGPQALVLVEPLPPHVPDLPTQERSGHDVLGAGAPGKDLPAANLGPNCPAAFIEVQEPCAPRRQYLHRTVCNLHWRKTLRFLTAVFQDPAARAICTAIALTCRSPPGNARLGWVPHWTLLQELLVHRPAVEVVREPLIDSVQPYVATSTAVACDDHHSRRANRTSGTFPLPHPWQLTSHEPRVVALRGDQLRI
mmetsp:Transcript_143148/g.398915  ORF Transcript_143148/g.398915 Transcript_143148/m.398915 type:complete len:271 (+) Transcript_143148:2-814(+)